MTTVNDNDNILGKDATPLRKYLDRKMFDIPLGIVFTLDNKSYVFKPWFIKPGIHATDRCDHCVLENTKYCNILKCTTTRHDLTWAYVVEDKPVDTIMAEKFPNRKHIVCEA